MDVEQFKQKFLGAARLFRDMNAQSGCCKWDKYRGNLLAAAVKHCMADAPDAKQGYTAQTRARAAFMAASAVAGHKAKTFDLKQKGVLNQIYEPIAKGWLDQLNTYALKEAGITTPNLYEMER